MKEKIESLLSIAYRAALQAGAEVMKVYESDDFSVERKDDDSPLTRADRRSHEVIEAALAQTGVPQLSEEGADIPGAERQQWELYWLIDPLDGTKEFIKRNGEFTVNIALMAPADTSAQQPESGQPAGHTPVAGVVYVPVNDIAYIGVRGKGAWKIEGAAEKAAKMGENAVAAAAGGQGPEDLAGIENAGQSLPAQDPQARRFTAVMSRSHNSPETEAYVAELEQRFGPAERVSSGSSIKLCLVAEGTADVYPRFAPTMEWDTAAGDAVCRASGCRVTEKDGTTPLRYNKAELLNPWFLVQGPRIM